MSEENTPLDISAVEGGYAQRSLAEMRYWRLVPGTDYEAYKALVEALEAFCRPTIRSTVVDWRDFSDRHTDVEIWVSTYPGKPRRVELELDQGIDACADLTMDAEECGRLIDALQEARSWLQTDDARTLRKLATP